MSSSAISVRSLTFSHNNSIVPSLIDFNLELPQGSRTLLVGANGAGKSTLLQILAGKRMTKGSYSRVLGKDVFTDPAAGITYLGTEWAMNPVVRGDIMVSTLLDSVGGYRYKSRRDALLDILDVDLDWHMHTISDGERRRVQLVMGLMGHWDVLLLDEVTVDLDVLVRDDLLKFLKEESENRHATILYATHIFDGLHTFPTHIVHMRFGSLVGDPIEWHPDTTNSITHTGSSLHHLALNWLREDKIYRMNEENTGKMKKNRGARRNQTVPTDSELFYKK